MENLGEISASLSLAIFDWYNSVLINSIN